MGALFGASAPGGDAAAAAASKAPRVRASTRADSDSDLDDDEENVSSAGTYQCIVKARPGARRARAPRRTQPAFAPRRTTP